MNKIISVNKVSQISKKIKKTNKSIVVAGGCFDILHIGHTRFLTDAKKHADFLLVLLESDEAVRKLKGKNRPINTAQDRAEILSSLNMVDYVIILPKTLKDREYDDLILSLKPDIIATTVGDKNEKHKKRQAKKLKSKLIYVKKIQNKSTSKIINSF